MLSVLCPVSFIATERGTPARSRFLTAALGGDGHRLVGHLEVWRDAADEFLRGRNLALR